MVNCVLLGEGIASGRAAERVFRRPAAAEDDMKTAILSTENAQGRAHAPLGYVHTQTIPSQMMNRVKDVRALPGFRLEVSFRNGERGVFDCNPYKGYECLAGIWAEGVFDKVVADHGTVMWPNGADLCPDEVYENSTKIGALK